MIILINFEESFFFIVKDVKPMMSCSKCQLIMFATEIQ